MIRIPFSPEYAVYVRKRLLGAESELFAARYDIKRMEYMLGVRPSAEVEAMRMIWEMYNHLWHNQGLQKLHPVNAR